MREFHNKSVEAIFNAYPDQYREKLLVLRELIFNVAGDIKEKIGEVCETLKWGEPSYLPVTPNIGSTVRIAWHQSTPDQYAIYFNCKTTLIDSFKGIYGDLFFYGGNRSIIFNENDIVSLDELSDCIAMSLTYHLDKNRRLQCRNKK